MNAEHHHGVVFVDRDSIDSDNIGGLVQSLIDFYDRHQALDWTDIVMFLSPAAP